MQSKEARRVAANFTSAAAALSSLESAGDETEEQNAYVVQIINPSLLQPHPADTVVSEEDEDMQDAKDDPRYADFLDLLSRQ